MNFSGFPYGEQAIIVFSIYIINFQDEVWDGLSPCENYLVIYFTWIPCLSLPLSLLEVIEDRLFFYRFVAFSCKCLSMYIFFIENLMRYCIRKQRVR